MRTSGPDAADNRVRIREPSQEIKDNATYWQTATSRLSVFTTYVLPMMFALLGTLISAFRAIINRVRDCTLAPRDFVRMLLGIPTGLVAGVAVGLFLSPSSVPIQGSGGLAGQVTLTAIGFGFIAGYASHSFFNYLDTVVGAAFPAASSETVPATGSAHIGTANGDLLRRGGDARAGAAEPSTATAGSTATATPTSPASVSAGNGN